MLLRKIKSLIALVNNPTGVVPAIHKNLAILRARLNGRGYFTYTSPLGTSFLCFPDNAASLRIYIHGYQEMAEVKICQEWLKEDDLCIDIGANIGWFTVVFSHTVGKKGYVLALEPSPLSFVRLVETVEHLELRNTIPIACCASNRNGPTSFFLSTCTASSPEEDSIRISESRVSQFRRSVVPCIRVESISREIGVDKAPTLIKIDVEGAEPHVLEGCRNILTGPSPPLVIIEIHRTALANFGFKPADILAHFPPERYDRFFIPRSITDQTEDRIHGRIYPYVHEAELPVYCNLIALPRTGMHTTRVATVKRQFVNFIGSR